MSSTAQVLANQHNAQHSTGPQTPQGKQNSSQNATRHGLTGSATILAHESYDDFEQLAAGIREQYDPQDDAETFLVAQMIQARWKLLRIQRLEAEAFNQILTQPGPGTPQDATPDARIVAALCTSGNPLEKLQRYSAAAERSYYKALHELEAARLRNKKTEAKMLDNYLRSVIHAPMPSATPPRPFQSALRNKPNSGAPTVTTENAYGLGNPALRL